MARVTEVVLEGQVRREVERSLERDTDLHDMDCECGPCVTLRTLNAGGRVTLVGWTV